jgi:glycosyltransferase involved in cell wall biosynthesis
MKILIATGIYPPQIGGPATYSKLLYDELPKRGIDVSVLSFGDFIDKPKLIRHVLYFFELLKKGKDADIIYAQDPVSVGLPALLASQILRKKFVLKIVGDYAWEQGVQRFNVADNLDVFSKNHDRYSRSVKMLKQIEKYVASGAGTIVTPSEYLKTIITNWGIDSSKIKVIYNGFNPSEVRSAKSVLRNKHSLHGTVIISVGRIVPWKGFGSIIEIMPLILKELPDAKLLIVGEGPDLENLKIKSENLQLNDRVTFTGKLDQSKLFEYIKASDVFVLNTSYEGFSHQIIETMALGTPIITTDVGGNPEAIKDRNTGLLVPFDDKERFLQGIVDIIRDSTLREKMVSEAKKKVKEFTDEKMLEKIAELLKNL